MDVVRAPSKADKRPLGRMPAIICTDVGHDPDDLLALIVAAAALPLRLVVTSDEFGGGQRARLARYLLNLCGRTGVVVVAGAEIEGADARWVCDGLVPSGFPPASSSFTGSVLDAVRTVLGESHHAVWIGQGPMTNLAQVYAADSELVRRLTIMQMGGGYAHLYRRPERASHNLRMDPASARAILTARDLDLSLVTSDVTFTAETAIDECSEVYQLLAAPNAPKWARLVAAGYDRWFAREHASSKAADPLTVTAAAGMGFVEFSPQRAIVAEDARMLEGSDGIELRMSTGADYPAFRTWITRVVRHALDAGMRYEPALVGYRPGDPREPAVSPVAQAIPLEVR